MDNLKIYADLNKWKEIDGQFRVLLTARGTQQDLQRYNVFLEDGGVLDFWMDDEDADGNPDPLYFQGELCYDTTAHRWVAVVNRKNIRNASEISRSAEMAHSSTLAYS